VPEKIVILILGTGSKIKIKFPWVGTHRIHVGTGFGFVT
jgi:hypothetical protein